MENTTLKVENLKPVILKAGVPLAVSLAGLIYAWIMSKKSFSSKVSSFSEIEAYGDTPEESFHSNLSSYEDEEEPATPTDNSVLSRSLVIHHNNNNNNPCLEKEITVLRSQIEGLQMRELALNLQFHHYCEMKEQESLLVEIKNMLSLETARVEFLDREISLIETETMRLENFTVQYLRILEQLVYMKSENRVLQKKVQKLLRKSKAQSLLIKEQTLKIKEGEEEIQRSHDALQKRDSVINELEGEIKKLQRVLDQFQDEKNELVKKLDTTEQAELHRKPLKYYLQVEVESGDDMRKEDYNKILNELEHVKKERAIEFEELIQLRRINGCLRQELMRHQDHNIEVGFEGSSGGVMMQYDSEHELHCYSLEHGNVSTSCIGSSSSSKRRRLLRRLKKWVEGSEKGRRVKPEVGVGGDSVSYGSEKPEVPVTPRFCSSA